MNMKSHRRIYGRIALFAATCGLLLFPASPSHAAVVGTYTTNCSSSSSFIAYSISAAVGDTLTVTNQSGGGVDCNVLTGGAVSGSATIPGFSTSRTFTVTGSGTMQVQSYSSSRITINITVPVVSAGSPGPSPVMQEFGKPATETCDAAQPAGLNWAGVPSGGWAHSWSQWMNGGKGGFVCARTLVYNSTQARWILG